MTNPLKSQFELNLGKQTYKARLTVEALMQIEKSVGCGVIKLATRMADGDISINDVIAVLLPAIRGGGNDIEEKDLHKIMSQVGVVECTRAVAELLANTLRVTDEEDEESEKKLEGEELQKSPTED